MAARQQNIIEGATQLPVPSGCLCLCSKKGLAAALQKIERREGEQRESESERELQHALLTWQKR